LPKSAAERCPIEPVPADATFNLSLCPLANVMNSCTVFTGNVARTPRMNGPVPKMLTGRKSFSGS
jgi:hypothetical protein